MPWYGWMYQIAVATVLVVGEFLDNIVVASRWGPNLDHQRQRVGVRVKRSWSLSQRLHHPRGDDHDIRHIVGVGRAAQLGEIGAKAILAGIELPVELPEQVVRDGTVLDAHSWFLP